MRTIFSAGLIAGLLAGMTRAIGLEAEADPTNVDVYFELTKLNDELARQ